MLGQERGLRSHVPASSAAAALATPTAAATVTVTAAAVASATVATVATGQPPRPTTSAFLSAHAATSTALVAPIASHSSTSAW